MTEYEHYRQLAKAKQAELSHEQEIALANRIAYNEPEALYELAEPYLLLALDYVEAFRQTHSDNKTPAMTLAKAARDGLFRAAREYSRGDGRELRFKAYALLWVRRYVGKAA